MNPKKIIYARGWPYGAPMVWLRGGGTRDPEVKKFLKDMRWWWNGNRYAYESAMYGDEFREVLRKLRDMGYEVLPKSGMDESYILDLDKTNELV